MITGSACQVEDALRESGTQESRTWSIPQTI